MLYSTSLLALVGSGQKASFSPRRLQLHNSAEGTTICELNFTSSILNVLLSRKRLVVVLELKIHIFDISTMKIVKTIETEKNERGLCAMSTENSNNAANTAVASASSSSGAAAAAASAASMANGATPSALLGTAGASSAKDGTASTAASASGAGATVNAEEGEGGGGCTQYLAFPAKDGQIALCNAMTGEITKMIQAHKSSISIFAFNHNGTRLATASQKGTVIRIFSVPSGELVCTLRRGSYSATIYSIAFNSSSTMVSVSSSNGTVHVFKLPQYDGRKLRTKSVGSFTDVISNMWESVRDFAHAKYKPTTNENRNICAFSPMPPGKDKEVCNVVSFDGFLHRYAVDVQQPGEMKLLSSDRLI